jgi:hypothetical protein
LGTIRLDGDGLIWIKPHGKEEFLHEYTWEDRGYSGDCVHALQAHVVDHLLNGSSIENTAREYLRNVEIEKAIYSSNDQQKWIAF